MAFLPFQLLYLCQWILSVPWKMSSPPDVVRGFISSDE